MCTVISYQSACHYFGRTLDYEFTYGEQVVITPRRYPFRFRLAGEMPVHYAMIGMAHMENGYPLYYEATNEKGLSMAGLNFPGHAHYFPEAPTKDSIAPFELIPWLLGDCASVAQAEEKLGRLNLTAIPFSETLPLSPLHWLLCDREKALTIECTREGLQVYPNPVGVLTNNPPFPYQMYNLRNYRNLSREPSENRFAPDLELTAYSRGMGAIGLPGDLSSQSRFVRAAFTRLNSVCGEGEGESVSQFFHILGAVQQTRGCVHMGGGEYEITQYTSCCNTDTGVYYYTTYNNSQLTGVSLYGTDLEKAEPVCYPLQRETKIWMEN